jgi:hypothetical protein
MVFGCSDSQFLLVYPTPFPDSLGHFAFHLYAGVEGVDGNDRTCSVVN